MANYVNLYRLTSAPARDDLSVSDPSWRPVPARPRKILVADDQESICHVLTGILAGDGFEVNTASDGEQAWELLLQEHFDLLVADGNMPRLGGIGLMQRIREAGMTLPIVIVSHTFSARIAGDDPQLQVAAVFLRPFEVREFSTVVSSALQVSDGAAAAGREKVGRLPAGSQSIHQ